MELIRDPRHEECLDRLSAGLRDPVPETEDCAKLRYARLDHCEAVCEALDKEGYLYLLAFKWKVWIFLFLLSWQFW